jgi:hypothetical protein
MIAIALIIAGIAATVFVVLVVGIQVTDHRMRLREPHPSGIADALARKVLGVYTRQTPTPARDEDEAAQWLTRR